MVLEFTYHYLRQQDKSGGNFSERCTIIHIVDTWTRKKVSIHICINQNRLWNSDHQSQKQWQTSIGTVPSRKLGWSAGEICWESTYRIAGYPGNITASRWFIGQLPHCVEMKHSGGLSANLFGDFQLGCTLLIPGLKAEGWCKEHFQRADSGGGEVWGGEERDGKKSFLWWDLDWEPNSSTGESCLMYI